MRVLVIGGAGAVGRMILPLLCERFEVLVLDRRGDGLPPSASFIKGDATDYESVRAAAEGCGAVVYLAMGPKQEWNSGPDWTAAHFDVNVKGVFQALTAAADTGCQRAVIASSMSVFTDYLAPAGTETAPSATDVYGLTKRLGEVAAQAVAVRRELPVIALRLVGPLPDEEWQGFRDPMQEDVVTAATDVASAFLAALVYTPSQWFDSVVISGDASGKRLDLTHAREVLGWRPLARRRADQSIAPGA